MVSALRRVLSVALCLVVLLPPGWCCYLGGGACCDKPAPLTGEAPAAPCGGGCRDCCCHHDDHGREEPCEAPARPPLKSCCCQKYAADRPEPGRGPVWAETLALPAAVPQLADALGEAVLPEPRPVTFSPHLHVLLCVWLC